MQRILKSILSWSFQSIKHNITVNLHMMLLWVYVLVPDYLVGTIIWASIQGQGSGDLFGLPENLIETNKHTKKKPLKINKSPDYLQILFLYIFLFICVIFQLLIFLIATFTFSICKSSTFLFLANINTFLSNCFSVNVLLYLSSRGNILLSVRILSSFLSVNLVGFAAIHSQGELLACRMLLTFKKWYQAMFKVCM